MNMVTRVHQDLHNFDDAFPKPPFSLCVRIPTPLGLKRNSARKFDSGDGLSYHLIIRPRVTRYVGIRQRAV